MMPTVGVTGPAPVLACVLDTNIVLDVWVFDDPEAQPLRLSLGLPDVVGQAGGNGALSRSGEGEQGRRIRWLATPEMRAELARVLTYPHLVRRQPLASERAERVLSAYDAAVTWCDPAPRARFVCTDGDDQKFIDLAVAHHAILVSKDKAVLRLKKRLATLGVHVMRTWSAETASPGA